MRDVGQRVKQLPPRTRRVIVAVVAGVLFLAAALIVPVPGPFSILLLVMGLTVLSWEFEFAQDLRSRAKAKLDQLKAKTKGHHSLSSSGRI